MSKAGSNINVTVRVRPLSSKETGRSSWNCLAVQDGRQINVSDPDDKMGGTDYLRLDKTKDKSYAFDHAFGPESAQVELYEATAKSLVPEVISGCNACCFAYGATGSGKTYTMMGSSEAPGVIPLAVEALFTQVEAASEEYLVTVKMQYVEIYNEQIKDLLEPEKTAKQGLDVREAPGKGTFVAGAANMVVGSRKELEALMHKGNLYRTTEATNCNEVSSRSHAVLQLRVESQPRFEEGGKIRVGKLSMIDLAGSERATKTNNAGKRLVEGANINRSLLALANCINALADRTKKSGHIPYRDSKLTRLLKDSLGGSCRTLMITNVSPASDQFDETLNSLKYANRAKNIRTQEVTVQVHLPGPSPAEQLELVREMKRSLGSRDEAPGAPPGKAAKGGKKGGKGAPRRGSAPAENGAKAAAAVGVGSDRSEGGGSSELARKWHDAARAAGFIEAHEMLDQLERDAVAELQLELAALLAERTQMQETRGRETVERWCALLRIARTTPVEQAVEQAAELEDEQAELAREVLFENQRKLAAVRASMLSGMPSDERSELVHSMWENAVLRAEVHACQQALGACQTQLSELAAVSQAAGWEPRATASLLTELSVEAAAARSESEETIASLAQPFGVDGKADVPSGRAGHLAQLVPALLRHNASRFGQVIRDARAMLAHHRRERESLCGELDLVRKGESGAAPTAAPALLSPNGGGGGGGGGGGKPRGPGGLVRAFTRRLSTSIGSKRKDADGGDEIRL